MDMAIQTTLAQSQNALASAKSVKAAGMVKSSNMNDEKATAAAKEFEAVYISQMLTHMFEGIETDGMFGGGHAEEIYRSMMVDEYGKLIAQTGGVGVADNVKAEILALQEKQQVSLGDLQNDK